MAILLFAIAALLTAAAGFWALRAYRRAGATRAAPAFAAFGAIVVVALATYLALGRPDLPDAPYAERLEALMERSYTTYTADEWLAVLADAAREDPAAAWPHLMSGKVLFDTGRPDQAARAYDAALRRDPQSVDAMLGLGRALVQIEGGVSPNALRLFEQASTLTDDPTPWLYQGMAAVQENRAADAQRFGSEALRRMAPDDPRREMAQVLRQQGQ